MNWLRRKRTHKNQRKAGLDRIGLQDMLPETVAEFFANWWWLIALVATIGFLRAVAPGRRSRRKRRGYYSRSTGRRKRRAASRQSFVAKPQRARQVESPARTISGKAYVTDGDGTWVAQQEVRIAGLDAPEWDQKAKHKDGYWFKHGKRVKSALIQEIGGKRVHVSVESVDKFGRLLGTVTCNGRDIGNGSCGRGTRSLPMATATSTSSGRHAKRSAACGRTPITSIPELTGTGSSEKL